MKKKSKSPMQIIISDLASQFSKALQKKTGVPQHRARRVVIRWMQECLIDERRSNAAISRWKKCWRKEMDIIVKTTVPRPIQITPSAAAIAYAYGAYAARKANESIELKKASAEASQ